MKPIPTPEPFPKKSISIDEDGYFVMNGLRVTDAEYGKALLSELGLDDKGRLFTQHSGESILVEAFDSPLVATGVDKGWSITAPYGFSAEFEPYRLSLDEWDRFHGITTKGIPFVFSRSAQAQFFNLLDSFDDTSITIDGKQLDMPEWLMDNPLVDQPEYWSHVYQTEEPGWELGTHTPILTDVLPQLKIPKSRIICLGAGSANDAAFLARQGHLVTAVDFSHEALDRAKNKYSDVANLWFKQLDVFKIPPEMRGQFDIVFEHTCYCAIRPPRRTELMRQWMTLLAEDGHLLGVFFVREKRDGPPWGGSEWELRQRLQKYFQFIYWTRWKNSISRRQGTELVIYAKKNNITSKR